MLVLGGHNAVGSLLRVVVGPETDLHQDIHGAKILDITPILSAMSGENKVYLSLTRCRSEQITAQIMSGAQIPYLNSFTGNDKPGTPQVAVAAKEDKTVTAAVTQCTYCGNEASLLPIDGFKICNSCAVIELGRRLKRK